ncbi:conserved Plasmodium protein, unknown function [Plasmodium malariae]|uniref:Uncharacterized protein n=1 Tax=Plasmodium malariae TaxID=5858 RepID=A0A1D3RIC9_PLAMA|nr:conserved Plasmodium protein, unknown function [Plasmodium malariae]SCN44942.1 conserved Plasmodium protein, unknown function [Plasmodium malariae]
MERYKLFINELKEENKKIRKKIIFVNNKIKYKVLNDGVIKYNKYFVKSYREEKKNNVYKYYKHKITSSKRKKKFLNDDFPYFEIYKNTNDAFKNNLSGYRLLKIMQNYNELKLFHFCAKNDLKNYAYLYSHIIEIVIKKRDLYTIDQVLLLTDNIRKLNYYNPYFCKLICREVYLDIYKIKHMSQITRFIKFLMHFNIFNFYYLDKIYKYIIYLVTQSNGWKLTPVGANTATAAASNATIAAASNATIAAASNATIAAASNATIATASTSTASTNNDDDTITFRTKVHVNEEGGIRDAAFDAILLPVYNGDIATLSTSFLKYKHFNEDMLMMLIYLYDHENYKHLKNVETLYHLSTLSEYYNFINKYYNTANFFMNTFKNDILKNTSHHSNFILLMKTFYNICKMCNTSFHFDTYNLIIQKYGFLNDKLEECVHGGVLEARNAMNYVLTACAKKKKKKNVQKIGKDYKNENKMEHKNEAIVIRKKYNKDKEEDKQQNQQKQNQKQQQQGGKKSSTDQREDNLIAPHQKAPFQPFNMNIHDNNLKRHTINDDYLIMHSYNESHANSNNFYYLFDAIKYIILFVELKILSFSPFKKKKIERLAEIEFLKRKNFERDNEKNVYKYISQNISKEQREHMEYILRTNKHDRDFDDTNLKFLFYLNYNKYQCDNDTYDYGANLKEESNDKWEEETTSQNERDEKKEKTQRGIILSSDDINNYVKEKQDIKFNLKDDTYFSHIFFHLSSIQFILIFFFLSTAQFSKEEERIMKESLEALAFYKSILQRLDVNDVADLFYFLTVFQVIQGYQEGTIKKNEYGYYEVMKKKDNEELYKLLSNILIKKIINIREENLYKIILSCANTAYSDVYLNHFLKNFNRHIKFSKMRKFMNC